MKDIKQIRRKYDIITESSKSEANKLKALVQAGLFEGSKLPIVKKIMTKDPGKATIAEHKFLVNLLESLIENFLSDNYEQLNEKVNHLSKYDPRFKDNVSDKDMPVVIILKRKAIRVYPDNQKVALYYSQALDKYVTIPFGPNTGSLNEDKKYIRVDDEDDLRYATRTQTITKKKKLTPEQEADFAARKKNIKLRMIAARKQKTDNPSISSMNRKTAKNWLGKLKSDIANIPTKEKTVTKRVDLYKQAPSQLQSPEEYGRLQKSLSQNIGAGDINPLVGAAVKLGVRHGYKSAQKKAAVTTPSITESFRQKLNSLKEQSAISSFTHGFAQGVTGGAERENDVADIQKAQIQSSERKHRRSSKAKVDSEEASKVVETLKKERAAAVAANPTAATIGTGVGAATALVGGLGAAKLAATGIKKATSKFGNAGRQKVNKRRRAADAALGLAAGLGGGAGGGKGGTAAERLPRAQASEFSLKPTLDNAQQRAVSSGVDDPVAIRRQTAALYKTNESVINTFKRISKNNQLNESVININGTSVMINKIIASKIVETYDSLNAKNKKKMINMMNESADSFKKIVNFVARQ
jgi:hypothetical protein